jgi:hypothetical protein
MTTESSKPREPWRCGNCCQMNAAWATVCGRCGPDAAPAAPAREWSDADVDAIVRPIIACVNDSASDMARKLVRAGLSAQAQRSDDVTAQASRRLGHISDYRRWQSVDAWQAMYDAAPAPAREWACFHCGEVFADEKLAADHFGRSELAISACQVDAAHLRELEAELARYCSEDTDLHREIYAMAARHAVELIREEEKGYAAGLAAAPAAESEQERVSRIIGDPRITVTHPAAPAASPVADQSAANPAGNASTRPEGDVIVPAADPAALVAELMRWSSRPGDTADRAAALIVAQQARIESLARDLTNERRVVTIQSEARVKAEAEATKLRELLRRWLRITNLAKKADGATIADWDKLRQESDAALKGEA